MNELDELRQDWNRNLRAGNKARRTIAIYDSAATALIEWLEAEGLPCEAAAVTRSQLEDFFSALSERPSKKDATKIVSPAYVSQHYRALQQFFRWLEEVEQEITASPFSRMKPPIVPEHRTDVLTVEQIQALLASCKGPGFKERRDTALIRMFIDTGARRSELANLTVLDLDFAVHTAHVVGKGRRPRAVSFGDRTAEAVRRYMRSRARHPMAQKSDRVWLSHLGPLESDGVRQMLTRRAEKAGVPDVHPHRFRHTFAHRWLADGNAETDLMRLGGWRSRSMIDRYTASAADERAQAAHKRAALGDRI